jgi:hypothetical protein
MAGKPQKMCELWNCIGSSNATKSIEPKNRPTGLQLANEIKNLALLQRVNKDLLKIEHDFNIYLKSTSLTNQDRAKWWNLQTTAKYNALLMEREKLHRSVLAAITK